MARMTECCGWLGWAAMAGMDEHGHRVRNDDVVEAWQLATSGHRRAPASVEVAPDVSPDFSTGCTPRIAR